MKIIITHTDVAALLKAADGVLTRYDKHEVPERIKGQVVLSVLKNMTSSSHFSICSVTEMAELNEVTISPEHKALFRSLHCVSWNQMHPDTKEYLLALLIDYF